MRTLPDPFGIPGPSFMPSLSARTIPKFYPPDFGSHTMRIQTLQVGGWHPVRASQMAKNSPASPRVVRRGTARPAENRFAWPPWRPNTEILPQSAGPDNPESCFGAYRGTRTIAIPPCRRTFFTTEHTESGFAGHRRRLGIDVVPTLQPQSCHRGGTRSVASASPTRIPISHTEVVSARRAMYPRHPRRVASERGRVAMCYDRLDDRPTHNMRSPPASGRLTRSRAEARRHGGVLRVGLRTSQSRRL